MSEISQRYEPLPRERLEYGAVPLQPWAAKYPGTDENYFEASRLHLEQKAYEAVMTNPYLSEASRGPLVAFLTESLLAAHTNRIDYNHDSYTVLDRIPDPDEVLQYAYDGLATPAELLDILRRYPELGSIELAKLSHPLDFEASMAMDTDVRDVAYRDPSAELSSELPRYRRKRVHLTLPIAIIVAKESVAMAALDDTRMIEIVARHSYLVRADDENGHEPDLWLQRVIRNHERDDDLRKFMDVHLSSEYLDAADQRVQPVTTSYYAKVVAKDQ